MQHEYEETFSGNTGDPVDGPRTPEQLAFNRWLVLCHTNVKVIAGEYAGRLGIIRGMFLLPDGSYPSAEHVARGDVLCKVRLSTVVDLDAFHTGTWDWAGGEQADIRLTDMVEDHGPGVAITLGGGGRGLYRTTYTGEDGKEISRQLSMWETVCSMNGCSYPVTLDHQPQYTLDYGSFSLTLRFCPKHYDEWVKRLGLAE